MAGVGAVGTHVRVWHAAPLQPRWRAPTCALANCMCDGRRGGGGNACACVARSPPATKMAAPTCAIANCMCDGRRGGGGNACACVARGPLQPRWRAPTCALANCMCDGRRGGGGKACACVARSPPATKMAGTNVRDRQLHVRWQAWGRYESVCVCGTQPPCNQDGGRQRAHSPTACAATDVHGRQLPPCEIEG
jgi:hypothetical protein